MPTSKSFMTQLGPVDPAMMDSLPETLDVEVISPCTGDQSLVRQSDELYAGSSGDFTYVTLYSISVSGNPSWEMKVWDSDMAPVATAPVITGEILLMVILWVITAFMTAR